MTTLFFQFVWQINDGEGVERAFLDAYPASYTEDFRNYRLLILETDSLNLVSHRRAEAKTRSTTTFGLASIFIKHGNSNHSFLSPVNVKKPMENNKLDLSLPNLAFQK